MSWRELLADYEEQLEWRARATEQAITATEDALKVHLPFDLRSFLAESNGLYWKPPYLDVVWSAEYMIEENLRLRRDPKLAEMCMPFENLLFFSSPGVDGMRFGFSITKTGNVGENVFSWEPLEDSRRVIAFSLKDFLVRSLNGTLTF